MAFQLANSPESFRNDDGDANENGKKAMDVTRDDSQRRFLAQHSVATLLRHCFEWLQHCSNIATLCCAKSRRCESSRVASPILSKTTTLYVHHAFLYISLLSLHDYSVKMPNFTFMDDVKKHRSPQPVPGSQIVQWERIKTNKAKIRRARLGKGGGGGRKNGRPISPQPQQVFRISFY